MRSLGLVLTLVGCAEPNTWSPHCEVSELALGWEEQSALGFSGAELLEALGTTASATMAWSEGGTSPLSSELEGPGAVTYLDSTHAEPPEDVDLYLDIGVICEDSLSVDLVMQLSTEDGGLDEALDLSLQASTADAASYFVSLEPGEIEGSIDLSTADDPRYSTSSVTIFGDLSEGGGHTGHVGITGEGQSEDVAFAEFNELGAWSPEGG